MVDNKINNQPNSIPSSDLLGKSRKKKKTRIRWTHLPYFTSTFIGTLIIFVFFGAILFGKSTPREAEVYQQAPSCPNNGYLYQDYCWYLADTGNLSCDQVCQGNNQVCVQGNWNDDERKNCPILNNFVNCASCAYHNVSYSPHTWDNSTLGAICEVRAGVAQDCSAPAPGYKRLCACEAVPPSPSPNPECLDSDDCDPDLSDLCRTNTCVNGKCELKDKANGVKCGGDNTVCYNGRCGCVAPFADCNKDIVGDGCEANISSDKNNCGKCDNTCSSNQICDNAKCVEALASPSPEPTLEPSPEATPSASPEASGEPEPTPEPGPSPSPMPEPKRTVKIKLKFSDVPANNSDMNLPDFNRSKGVRLGIIRASDGEFIHLGDLEFSYNEADKTWEAALLTY